MADLGERFAEGVKLAPARATTAIVGRKEPCSKELFSAQL
jgi:hypothetical protein